MFVICFISQWRSKHGLWVFPPKKTPIWRRHCSIGQSCFSITSKGSIGWFLESTRAWIFSPERSLNQPIATRVCIRSINQSNRSISVRFLFLFCSRVFISRSYKNRSIKRIRDFWANGVLHASWYFTQAISSYATMQWMPRYFYFQSFRNKVYRTHPWPAPIVFDGLPASLLSYTTDTSIAKPCFVDVYNIWTLLLLTGRF